MNSACSCIPVHGDIQTRPCIITEEKFANQDNGKDASNEPQITSTESVRRSWSVDPPDTTDALGLTILTGSTKDNVVAVTANFDGMKSTKGGDTYAFIQSKGALLFLLISSLSFALKCYIKKTDYEYGTERIESAPTQREFCLFTYQTPCPKTGEGLTLSMFTSPTQRPHTWNCSYTEQALRCTCSRALCNNPTKVIEMVKLTMKGNGVIENGHLDCLRLLEEASAVQQNGLASKKEPVLRKKRDNTVGTHAMTSIGSTQLPRSSFATVSQVITTKARTRSNARIATSPGIDVDYTDDTEVVDDPSQMSSQQPDAAVAPGSKKSPPIFPDQPKQMKGGLIVLLVIVSGLLASALIIVIIVLITRRDKHTESTKKKTDRSKN